MEVIFLLLPLVLLLAALAVVAFLWSLRNGQMDDLETPAVRSIFDDDNEYRVSEQFESGTDKGEKQIKS